MNPYVAGVGLGLVLLAAYVIMGRGLGASGAIGSFVSWLTGEIAPAHAEGNEFFRGYLEEGAGHPLKAWLVFEVLGVLVGGFLSGLLAGRVRATVEKGPRATVNARLAWAFTGGALMGVGAKLARGCTSGQALSGGAMLNAGSWAFMMMVFAGAYALAAAMRRQWR
ncbi:MAG: YeeE/YedE family protein [Candidatus Eisenbacteria bacterium]|uniref:YeeE/YedE family protein n=1 Tax=Eiseniibacteriota bacterium TaxID=2212470 RepID=A0A933W9K5_UNCEI|nr:YeeE/YedE family protein [Candidatus Eisenbacteria bacterium]